MTIGGGINVARDNSSVAVFEVLVDIFVFIVILSSNPMMHVVFVLRLGGRLSILAGEDNCRNPSAKAAYGGRIAR